MSELKLTPGEIATLTLEDAQGLNLLRVATAKAFLEHLEQLRSQTDLRALIITGAGQKAFCAGADMRELLSLSDIPAYVELGQEVVYALEHFPVPVIAAINGYALGAGFTLAMSCDLRVISDQAKIGQLAVRNGLIPPFGNIQQLLQIAGPARGRELIYTGRTLNALEAVNYQLVNQVVPAAQLLEAAQSLAQTIAHSPSQAVRLAKSVIVRTLEEGYSIGHSLQEEALMNCLASEASKAIMQGFLENQPPHKSTKPNKPDKT